MKTLRISLLGDGPSDRCLLVIVRRMIGDLVGDVVIESNWADLRILPSRPTGLAERVRAALTHYPSDILFVHRDAEAERRENRLDEIQQAVGADVFGWVPIVPVRMTEAWLLMDEAAIRSAADHPKGNISLALPKPQAVERDPDPKETLRSALVVASEKNGRRLRRFRETIGDRIQRVAEIMTDYDSLGLVPSYERMKRDTIAVLQAMGFLSVNS